MVVISKATVADVPSDIRMKMLVLHAPEKLGLQTGIYSGARGGPGALSPALSLSSFS